MPALTVADLVALYLRHSQANGVHCAASLAERQATLSLFVATYGALGADELKPYHLTDWIDAHPNWKAPSTRRGKADSVRACWRWAHEGERIARNPFIGVRYRESERRPDMPDDVLEQVAQLANKPFERALRFLRLTACRLGELCQATWPQFDLDRGVWTIPQHKSRKHTGRPKLIALVPEAVTLLRGLAAMATTLTTSAKPVEAVPTKGRDAVFVNNRGTPWTRITLGQQLRRMKARHGIEVKATLHGIRHRFGSAAVAAGAPLKLVSAQLGHSTSAITEKYYVDLSGEMDSIRAAAQLGMPRTEGNGGSS